MYRVNPEINQCRPPISPLFMLRVLNNLWAFTHSLLQFKSIHWGFFTASMCFETTPLASEYPDYWMPSPISEMSEPYSHILLCSLQNIKPSCTPSNSQTFLWIFKCFSLDFRTFSNKFRAFVPTYHHSFLVYILKLHFFQASIAHCYNSTRYEKMNFSQ